MEAHDVRAALDQSPIWTTEDVTALLLEARVVQ